MKSKVEKRIFRSSTERNVLRIISVVDLVLVAVMIYMVFVSIQTLINPISLVDSPELKSGVVTLMLELVGLILLGIVLSAGLWKGISWAKVGRILVALVLVVSSFWTGARGILLGYNILVVVLLVFFLSKKN